ncbi:MAG: hypothetical protein EON48_13730, partial [Acetobacteraceae bacterium]
MPPSEGSSWASSPVVLDERAALWAAVLARLGVGYPFSPYAKMGRADLEADGALWASEMREVPAVAIEELYVRTCRRRAQGKDAGFPPSIGDFRAAWHDPDWDFWAQQNSQPPLPALPAPLDEGPGARTALAQNEHRRKCGGFVCCGCRNEYGVAVTAVLVGAKWG